LRGRWKLTGRRALASARAMTGEQKLAAFLLSVLLVLILVSPFTGFFRLLRS